MKNSRGVQTYLAYVMQLSCERILTSIEDTYATLCCLRYAEFRSTNCAILVILAVNPFRVILAAWFLSTRTSQCRYFQYSWKVCSNKPVTNLLLWWFCGVIVKKWRTINFYTAYFCWPEVPSDVISGEIEDSDEVYSLSILVILARTCRFSNKSI